MNVTYFSLERAYEIKCKSFLPEHETVENVILGVHGFAGDKESSALEKLALACAENHTALICFDFPAHGDSPVNEEKFTVRNCKNDLLAVANHVAAEYPNAKKSVFATSFGGYITLLAAEYLKEFTFVLRAPAVTMPKILLENVLRISCEEFRTAGAVRCGFERPLRLPYAFYEELVSQEAVCARRISQPTLVIHGACDDIVPLSAVEAFLSAQDGVRLQIISGADHRFKKSGEMDAVIRHAKEFLLFSPSKSDAAG